MEVIVGSSLPVDRIGDTHVTHPDDAIFRRDANRTASTGTS